MHPISIFFRNRISTVKVCQQTWWLKIFKTSVNTAATEETEKHYSRQQNAFFKIENFKTG